MKLAAASLMIACIPASCLVAQSRPGDASAAVSDRPGRAEPAVQPVTSAATERGPFAVGYRLIPYRDATRALQPARDFEGRAASGDVSMPVQISVWYPAGAGGAPVRHGEYQALFGKRESLEPVEEADVRAAAASLRARVRFQLGLELSESMADSLMQAAAHARRDAAPAAGRFPLIVGGLEGPSASAGLAEYLASYGYVVATSPSLPRTATQQAIQPQIALETQTRNIELVHSVARALPFVDPTRLALIGLNFDGMAALVHQMRNGSARAVISLDGWEAKTANAAALRASPYFDPVRMRVPYLLFNQDNPPQPGLALDSALIDEFRYADRFTYVLTDMEHAQLLSDLTILPQLSAERRLAYDFYWRTIRAFLDAYVKDDDAARGFLRNSAVQNGYPDELARVERKQAALPAVPTAEEVERIAMSGDVARLAGIYRRARSDNPAITLFSPPSLNLFAFRFWQRNQRDVALQFHELSVEAFPNSAHAHNNLGNVYRDLGRTAQAIRSWQRALSLVDSDPDIASAAKAASRATIEQKIAQHRRP